MSNIITFYSYKGGVGRTMALANVSIQLAKWGHKVLVVDWDLEAPGLEHFYKDYFDINSVKEKTGVIDLLQGNNEGTWRESINEISFSESATPIHFISSGKRDEEYFKKVRTFDVDEFYRNGGGDVVEDLRADWLDAYDYVLIDSRTGITEIGGICTIQLPDIVVMLFTATVQGFEGTLDIIKRANAAQQKLNFDRQKLIFLPIPSKFETTTEFKLSQEWIETFAEKLDFAYSDWLPSSVNKKDFLELTKIPYIPYFSFGEKLPLIEQGTRDPSGLGYAYETLAGLVCNGLDYVEELVSNRDEFILHVNKNKSAEVESNGANFNNFRLSQLKQKLKINGEKVILEKNRETLWVCFDKIIMNLLNALSDVTSEVSVLFKYKNEKVNLNGTVTYHGGVKEPIISEFKIAGLHKYIASVYKNYENFNIYFIEYSCLFSQFRNSENNGTELPLSLKILFHELVYEIQSDFGQIQFSKLYSEPLTTKEINEITSILKRNLIDKIDGTLSS